MQKNKTSFYCNIFSFGLCIILCLCASLTILFVKDKMPETEDNKVVTRDMFKDDKVVTNDMFKAAVVEYSVVVPAQCSKVAPTVL